MVVVAIFDQAKSQQITQLQLVNTLTKTLDKTNHNDFCDLGLISPLFRLTGVTGPRDPRSTQNIMNNYIVAFFDQHLKRVESPLLIRATLTDSDVEFRTIDPVSP